MAEIETRHFDTADEFVNALRRSDPYWLPATHWQLPWIFRGQRDSDWKLVPSAWRKDVESDELYQDVNASDLDEIVRQVVADQHHMGVSIEQHGDNVRRLVVQNRYEFIAARGFAELVDDLGLPLPGGPLPRKINYDPFRWMIETEPFHPTVALAQHHGMRTRLLDWTHNPLIAAFFAADTARPDEPGNIVVWAVNRPLLQEYQCREFTVQRSQIGYLHAQEGLFTYSLVAEHWFLLHGTWPCLEETLPSHALRRLTLPKSQTPKLLRLLWTERISKAHLMPSLDNVTNALRSVWKEALRREVKE